MWEKKKMLVQFFLPFPQSFVPFSQHRSYANAYHLDQSKILSSGKELTHSYTTSFKAPGNKLFENTMEKGEIARNKQFLLFHTVFSTCLDNFLPLSSNLKLSSANSFSLDQSKILWTGDGFSASAKSNNPGQQSAEPVSNYSAFQLLTLWPIPTQWWLSTPLGNNPFENTVGKGEIACNEQFLLFPQCFLSIWITFAHFRQIWNCRLQTLSDWKSLNFVVW